MGANNVLPTVPTFTGNVATQISDLNNLSYAVSFLTDYSVRPAWSFFMFNGTQSISATTWTTMAVDHTAYDSDGVQSYPNAVIKTQGYYALTGCVQAQANANTADMYTAAFQITGGASNPHLALNANLWHGYKSGRFSSTAQAAADNAVCPTDITPIALYPGDKVALQVFLSAAHTLDFNQNTSYIQGRFAAKFSGHLNHLGS